MQTLQEQAVLHTWLGIEAVCRLNFDRVYIVLPTASTFRTAVFIS